MSSKYGTFYLGLLTEVSYLMPQIFSSVLVPKEGHACRDCSVAQGLTKQAFALQLHCENRKHALQMGAEMWIRAEAKDRVCGKLTYRSTDETEGLGVNCILFFYHCLLSCVTRDH